MLRNVATDRVPRAIAPRRPSRRGFLKCGLLGAAAMGAASRRASEPATGDEPADRATHSDGFVDVHTHLGQTWNNRPPLSAEELLRWMDARRIAQAVVLPLVSPESSSYLLTSDFVLAATAGHRDRLIPFCCLDPRTSYTGGRQGLLEMLRRWQDAGARGFGEHKAGVAIDDPRNMDLYAATAELRLPVLFHLDNQRNTDQPGLPGLERVLKAHPSGVFIGHGPGFWASIGGGVSAAELGGYPRGPVPPGGALDRLLAAHAHLYCDLSAGSGANAVSRDPDFGRAFLLRWSQRILFGSDFLYPGQEVPQFEVLEACRLPADAQAQIARENAQRLLQLA